MNASRSVCLVLHSKAATREDINTAINTVRGEGCQVEVRETHEPGDARRFARQAAKEGFDVVAAGGGDGTVNEVVCGLMDGGVTASGPSLAVVPLGTANDLAHAAGIPLDPLEALRLAVSQPAVGVDVGRVNGRCFLNMATGGFGAHVTAETPETLKKVLGQAAYVVSALTGFTSIRAARGRLTGPGLEWEGEFLVLAVGNSRTAGGGYRLCPEALLNDGLLDVRLLPSLPAEEVPSALGVLLGQGLDVVGNVVRARVASLRLETDEAVQINLDGEPEEDTAFRIEVLPGALQMKLPRDCPLLG